jgi:hypothetical protein
VWLVTRAPQEGHAKRIAFFDLLQQFICRLHFTQAGLSPMCFEM